MKIIEVQVILIYLKQGGLSRISEDKCWKEPKKTLNKNVRKNGFDNESQ